MTKEKLPFGFEELTEEEKNYDVAIAAFETFESKKLIELIKENDSVGAFLSAYRHLEFSKLYLFQKIMPNFNLIEYQEKLLSDINKEFQLNELKQSFLANSLRERIYSNILKTTYVSLSIENPYIAILYTDNMLQMDRNSSFSSFVSRENVEAHRLIADYFKKINKARKKESQVNFEYLSIDLSIVKDQEVEFISIVKVMDSNGVEIRELRDNSFTCLELINIFSKLFV